MLKYAYFLQKGRKVYPYLVILGIFVLLTTRWWPNEEFFFIGLWSLFGVFLIIFLQEVIIWWVIYFVKDSEGYRVCPDGKVRKKDSRGKPIYTVEELLDESLSSKLSDIEDDIPWGSGRIKPPDDNLIDVDDGD